MGTGTGVGIESAPLACWQKKKRLCHECVVLLCSVLRWLCYVGVFLSASIIIDT